MRIALVVATFYEDLAHRLLAGATARLAEAGAETDAPYEVPGCFELPAVASAAARSGRYAGVVCLGAVIRGETDHYDYVCGETARGIMDVTLRTGVPCGFGVLTVDTREQALARSAPGRRDTGANAASAVLAVVNASARIEAAPARQYRLFESVAS